MATYSTGVVNLVKGSANLNGIGTNWGIGAISSNWFITFDNQLTWYQIKSINSNTNLTLCTQYTGISQNHVSYQAYDQVPEKNLSFIYSSLFGNLPSTLPTAAGVLWNNQGAVSIT